MPSYIRPNVHVVLRLGSGSLRVAQIIPNASISIGKFGSFSANLLLGRPYHLTFEIPDADENGRASSELRVVPAAELHAEAVPTEEGQDDAEFDIVGADGEVLMRSNRLTVDDPSRQQLTMEEIEELKRVGTGSGRDIISKIMASHANLEEKTAFSLAKYTLRKSRKYLKRFTVLPLDASTLNSVLLEKEPFRILEMREESLGLICSWANAHYTAPTSLHQTENEAGAIGGGRWLVVDDTGGLVVAALAERMDILYPDEDKDEEDEDEEEENGTAADAGAGEDEEMEDANEHAPETADVNTIKKPQRQRQIHVQAMSATSNTLTLLHTAAQPNLGLLKNFSFDTSAPSKTHPLFTHLKTLTWLQLLNPEADSNFQEPPVVPPEELASMKSGKRGTYWRKRRRWERVKHVVEETRAGGFDGLVVASTMSPVSILRHCVPLLRGAAQVVVYSPTIEPLTELMDLYSRDRRSAYVQRPAETTVNANTTTPTNTTTDSNTRNVNANANAAKPDPSSDSATNGSTSPLPSLLTDIDSDFPLNPTLLLPPMLQTARVRQYQVLPGRTHPIMTSRGGAEGYLFTATRVLPFEGKVEARGRFVKKRKVDA